MHKRSCFFVILLGALSCQGSPDGEISESLDGEKLNAMAGVILEEDTSMLWLKQYELGDGPFRYTQDGDDFFLKYDIAKNREKSLEFRVDYSGRFYFVKESFCSEPAFSIFLLMDPNSGQGFSRDWRPRMFGGGGSQWLVFAEDVVDEKGRIKAKYRNRVDGIGDYMTSFGRGKVYALKEGPEAAFFFSLKWVPTRSGREIPEVFPVLKEQTVHDLKEIMKLVCAVGEKGENKTQILEKFVFLKDRMESPVGVSLLNKILEFDFLKEGDNG